MEEITEARLSEEITGTRLSEVVGPGSRHRGKDLSDWDK